MVHKWYSFCSGSGWLLLLVPHAVWFAETLCTLLPTKDSKQLLNCYSPKILYFFVQRSKAFYLFPAGSDWLFPRPFLLLMCLCSYFAHVTCSFFSRCLHGILCGIWYDISCERNSSVYFAHVTCSFFSRCLHGILCGIWYDISCERNSSVSRVTSLDLVKSVSTASKGLLRWLGWSIPFWEPCSWINS